MRIARKLLIQRARVVTLPLLYDCYPRALSTQAADSVRLRLHLLHSEQKRSERGAKEFAGMRAIWELQVVEVRQCAHLGGKVARALERSAYRAAFEVQDAERHGQRREHPQRVPIEP